MEVSRGGKFSHTIRSDQLSVGLRRSKRNPRNSGFMTSCQGAVGRDKVLQILDEVSRLATTVITDGFPYPQIFVFPNMIIVCSATTIYEYEGGALVVKYSTLAGDIWTAVAFHDYVYMSNNRVAVVRSAEDKIYSRTDDLPINLAACNYNGQVIIYAPEVNPEPPEYEGRFYCAYSSTGPIYYPANYSICEINVDLMQVAKTLELPTLPSGTALCPNHMAKSNIYLYAICRDVNPTESKSPYLATIKIGASALTLIDYYQLPDTIDGGFSVALDAVKSDLGISISDGELIVYSHAMGGPSGNDYAVYRKYSIGSDGIPVQADEVIFEDVDYKEAGSVASALVTGHLYTVIGMNTEAGRLVKLVESPFARDGFFDSNDDIEKLARCFGTCYDVDNNIVYLAINYGDVVGYQQQIIKVNISTMTLIDTLILSSSSSTIQSICDHPENGFIYASVQDNSSPHSSTLYEIRLSDFTVTRFAVYRGATNQCNGLYPDSERGYIYYCGNGSPAVDETEYKFFRFNLTSFSDDLGTYVDVSDPVLHWGISSAQSYCAKVNSLLPI